MIAIIDYDAGNIKSVQNALERLGEKVVLTRKKEELFKADKIILPGVGAFGQAIDNLNKYDLPGIIKELADAGKPLLGICLGLQLLLGSSEESPGVKGLDIIKGHVFKMPPKDDLKIPHMGWNSLDITDRGRAGRLLNGLEKEPYVYFVHSYFARLDDRSQVAAKCTYTCEMDVVIEAGNVFAAQFHPEKSSSIGFKILKNFLDL
ncbi:MAG: imidazole glycerol phosphate synthase subunit HisH [Clostridiales bacterium]|nr:imidazole glycerol phosphate synthase subunit HisH [Clostridiales bacterium]